MASSSSTSTVNSGRALRSRTSRRLLVSERVRHKRHVLQDMARPLKQWLIRHRDNPYPSKAEKVNLALGSHMTLVQVNNWFANARRRLKNVVQIPDVPWSQRIKLYNSHVEGNAELLSISSTDSIWEEENTCQKTATLHLADEHSYSATDSSTSEETNNGGTTKHMLERYLRDAWRSSYDSDPLKDRRSSDSANRYWEELDAALTLTRLAWQRQ